MADYILVQVPESEADALDQLRPALPDRPEVSEVQPFDGETVAQLIVAVTSISAPIVIAWIKARAESRKSFQIVVDGVQLNGYTPAEVSRMTRTIEQLAKEG